MRRSHVYADITHIPGHQNTHWQILSVDSKLHTLQVGFSMAEDGLPKRHICVSTRGLKNLMPNPDLDFGVSLLAGRNSIQFWD